MIRIKRYAWLLAGLGCLLCLPFGASAQVAQPAAAPAPAQAAPAAMRPEEKAVRDAIAGYVQTFNQRNAAAMSAAFTEDAALVDSSGVATRGKAAIADFFADAFSVPSTYTLASEIESVRFLTQDVAQVEGTSRLTAPKDPTIATRFVGLLIRQANAWKIAELRDYPAPADAVPPYERLKEIEWMVGDWIDQDDDSKIESSVRWGPGKGFLIRNYSVEVKDEPPSSGMMVIGWDPVTGQIKSWVFNSEGGQGEGLWTRTGDAQWVIKAHGTTSDGTPTSATQIITLVNKDAVKTSSIDRIIAGELAPDIEDLIMVRKAPVPAAEGAAPAAPGAGAAAPGAAVAAPPAPGR
jgi:uncharacterized protein (TIGR02246 family)